MNYILTICQIMVGASVVLSIVCSIGAWRSPNIRGMYVRKAREGLELSAGKALETPPCDEACKKLQTDLGLAEVRIKQLQEQLTACEAGYREKAVAPATGEATS